MQKLLIKLSEENVNSSNYAESYDLVDDLGKQENLRIGQAVLLLTLVFSLNGAISLFRLDNSERFDLALSIGGNLFVWISLDSFLAL